MTVDVRFYKKKTRVELTDSQLKWNKLWDLGVEGKVESPIGELMTYQSEINNGGLSQYFFNTENTDDLQMNLVNVLSILPKELKDNLENAYKAYMVLEQNEDDEEAEEILEKCDDFFYENEQKIIPILEQYLAKNM